MNDLLARLPCYSLYPSPYEEGPHENRIISTKKIQNFDVRPSSLVNLERINNPIMCIDFGGHTNSNSSESLHGDLAMKPEGRQPARRTKVTNHKSGGRLQNDQHQVANP